MPLEECVSGKSIFWSTLIGKSRERKKITSYIVLLSHQPTSGANPALMDQLAVLAGWWLKRTMQEIIFFSAFACKSIPKCIFFPEICSSIGIWKHRESVAGSVIQATGTVEFEDGLRTGVLPGGCWCPCGGRTQPRIKSNPPWGCGLILGAVWLSKRSPVRPNSNSAEFRASVALNYSCCGVRIELAVGSIPYPRQSGTPTVWQKGVQPPLGQRLYPK